MSQINSCFASVFGDGGGQKNIVNPNPNTGELSFEVSSPAATPNQPAENVKDSVSIGRNFNALGSKFADTPNPPSQGQNPMLITRLNPHQTQLGFRPQSIASGAGVELVFARESRQTRAPGAANHLTFAPRTPADAPPHARALPALMGDAYGEWAHLG